MDHALLVSLILGRAIATQLGALSRYDPVVLGIAVLLLLSAGVIACWIPARRAALADPMMALRYE